MRTRTLPVLSAALIAFFLAVAHAGAQDSGDISFPPPADPQCRAVNFLAPGTLTLSSASVVRTVRIGCTKGRKLVRRCFSGDRVQGWKVGEFSYKTALTRGRKRVSFHMLSGPPPRCLRTRGDARPAGVFGPFETSVQYPDTWPPPYKIVTRWPGPVTTYSAVVADLAVSTVDIWGYAQPSEATRAVWFEYGTTRDLGTQTDKLPPPAGGTAFTTHLAHLKAKTRYFWRAAASVDTPAGGVETVYGALGSFVTNPYPTITDPAKPCLSAPASGQSTRLFELTESLAINCAPSTRGSFLFEHGGCFPACFGTYSGRTSCSKDFPRNLNAGSWSFNIPKLGIPINVNELVSYWRDNDSNRFMPLGSYNKNSEGGEVGPVPGWHDWDVEQWGYPFTPTQTRAQFWINCTEQWGNVINGEALAQGQGTDVASFEAPGVPANLQISRTGSGSVAASWDAPGSSSPSGIAGYFLTYQGWPSGSPKTFDGQITPLTVSGRSGTIDKAQINVIDASTPRSWDRSVAVAAISREGTIGKPALVPFSP